MWRLAKTCQNCRSLLSCRLLADEEGRFVLERLITKENPRDCEEWNPVTPEAESSRDWLYQISGIGSLRALHAMPPGAMEELAMSKDTPDFRGMINDGVTTVAEREEQLRYKIDEEGNFIVSKSKDGEVRRRPQETFHLKQYASDPDGPIQLSHGVVLSWNINQHIDHILKVEVEKGLIVKTKGKTSKRVKPKNEPEEAKEIKMAVGRPTRVTSRRAGSTPTNRGKTAPAGGGRVARAPRKTGAPATEQVGEGVKLEGTEAIKELVGKLIKTETDALKGELLGAIAELRELNIKIVTVLHDMLVQTAGTMEFRREDDDNNPILDADGNEIYERLPELSLAPSKILAYIDGTWEDARIVQGEAESPTQ